MVNLTVKEPKDLPEDIVSGTYIPMYDVNRKQEPDTVYKAVGYVEYGRTVGFVVLPKDIPPYYWIADVDVIKKAMYRLPAGTEVSYTFRVGE